MNYKREIQPVTDNEDKRKTYAHQMGRYKKAMKEQFYFEAILITYAALEDRLRAFLYYLGAFRDKDSAKMDTSCSRTIRKMYLDFKKKEENYRIKVNNISTKEDLLRVILNWVLKANGTQETAYLNVLKRECEGLDIGGVLETLDAIDEWCKYRNEIIHGLLNKNVGAVDLEIEQRVIVGMDYVRFLDSQVKILKKKNLIRNVAKLKTK